MGEDLPDGWVVSTLGEVCQVNPPKPGRNEVAADAEVTFVPMPAVDADSGTIAAPQIRGFDEVRKGFTAFREDDVIMAKITPCMENGKAAIARGLRNGLGFGSTEFHVFRSRGAVLPEYVYYFIRQESFRSLAEMEMTGSVGQKRVPADFVESAETPIPPLAEQKRIVETIERLTARVDAARERMAKAPAILKRFRQAVLAAACSGRLTDDWREAHPDIQTAADLLAQLIDSREERCSAEKASTPRKCWTRPKEPIAPFNVPDEDLPDNWAWASLDQCFKVQRGRFLVRPRNDPRYYDGPFPFVQIGDLPPNGGEIVGFSQTLNKRGLDVSRMFPAGTVLIAIVGATIGNTGILTIDSCCPDSLIALQADDPIRTRYAEFYMRLRKLEVRDISYASGGQPNINLGTLTPYPLPLPPKLEQHEIVSRVDALLKLADVIEQRVAIASARADKVTQAILAKAFRGELVATEADLARAEGREYESADKLLHRLTANVPPGNFALLPPRGRANPRRATRSQMLDPKS